VNNPEEMIQKHSNGSFYTHAPIDMWEAINQHVSLATSTKSPVLHVMIAEKVVVSLQDLFNTIINYVQTLDTSNKPELRYAPLCFVCMFLQQQCVFLSWSICCDSSYIVARSSRWWHIMLSPLRTTALNAVPSEITVQGDRAGVHLRAGQRHGPAHRGSHRVDRYVHHQRDPGAHRRHLRPADDAAGAVRPDLPQTAGLAGYERRARYVWLGLVCVCGVHIYSKPCARRN
jgi:hypothetical protein